MIPVTPETVKAVYVMLNQFPPFARWNLPAAEKIVFAVDHLKSMWGDYDPNTKTLRISTARVSSFQNLVLAVAHEMVHLKQDVAGRWPSKDGHNAEFRRMAHMICKHFDFDPLNF